MNHCMASASDFEYLVQTKSNTTTYPLALKVFEHEFSFDHLLLSGPIIDLVIWRIDQPASRASPHSNSAGSRSAFSFSISTSWPIHFARLPGVLAKALPVNASAHTPLETFPSPTLSAPAMPAIPSGARAPLGVQKTMLPSTEGPWVILQLEYLLARLLCMV